MIWIKRIAIGLLCLVSLVGLLFAVENWRGKHAWAKWQREREAQGDRYEWSAVLPAPVPDAENFATTPLFAELFPKPPANPRLNAVRLPEPGPKAGKWRIGRATDLAVWRTCFTNEDLLVALRAYDPLLTEVAAAAQRPRAQFPVHYEDGYNALLPHLTPLRELAKLYSLRATAHLDAGNADAALADVQTCRRLADALRGEPILISFLVRGAILELAIQPVWEGLATHRWNAQQLVALEAEFARANEIALLVNALQGERRSAYGIVRALENSLRSKQFHGGASEDFLRWTPSGWLRQNLLRIDRFYVEHMLPAIDGPNRRLDVKAFEQMEPLVEKRHPYNLLALMLLPAVQATPRRAGLTQTGVDQLQLACALERYRLARGELPRRLEDLVPDFIAQIPCDVVDGQPLRYRATGADKFILWSVGWNQTDDDGQVVLDGNKLKDDQGDWVWQ
jgi:hypothetical protein